jgi:hypothetical protein
MPKTYLVKQGDHLSSIAADHGIANYHRISDAPENADLASERDPHVLAPGDQVIIPDRNDKQEFRPTGASHPFQVDIPPLFLRIQLKDLDDKPIANADCDIKLDTDSAPSQVKTDGNGFLLRQISRNSKSADLTVHLPSKTENPDAEPPDNKVAYAVHIGNLNPHDKLSGQQARLNNMGYFAGYTLRDIDEFLWASEEFECDYVTKPVRKKRPKVKAAPKEGEDNGTPASSSDKTGLQDSLLIEAIKKKHGI